MVTGSLDTAIIIDLLRRYPIAEQWLSRQSNLGITPMVILEVIEGAQNKAKQNQAIRLLNSFQLISLIDADFDWAIQQAALFKLSHSVGVMDCLIATLSWRLKVPFYTRNLKHFTPLLGTLAQKPY
jgi:predicted nucleic acid-binding protein